ncbi:MAG: glutathione S-transferase family protein [Sandaracinaceae bacterium]
MAQLTLYGFAPSTYVRTARIACEEKGVPYQLAPLEMGAASHADLHPFRKMPAMAHGDVRLFETLAIVAYVDGAFDGPALLPAAPLERARALGWVSACIDYVYPAVVQAFLEAGAVDDDEVLASARRTLSPFDAALAEATYLGGGAPDVADLFLAPMVAYAAGAGARDALLEGAPGLARWLARVGDRPSFAATAPA